MNEPRVEKLRKEILKTSNELKKIENSKEGHVFDRIERQIKLKEQLAKLRQEVGKEFGGHEFFVPFHIKE